MLEIDEELLDEGLAVGSYRLVEPPGLRRDGRGLARQASAARASGGGEADSSRRAAGRRRTSSWCGDSSAKRRSRPVCARRTRCSSTISA